MKYELKELKLSDIEFNDYNPNTMPDNYYIALKNNIQSNGYLQPLLINKIDDKYIIIDGEHRYKALKELGYKKVDCFIISITENEAKKLTLTMGLHGNYDSISLSGLLDGLIEDMELNISTIELDMPHIDLSLLDLDIKDNNESNKSDIEDNIPIVEEKNIIAKTGDVWILGKHKLLCGDSTKESDVKLLMDGNKADMVFTDPPYGVSYADKNTFLNSIDKGNKNQKEIKNDHLNLEEVSKLWLNSYKNIINIINDYSTYYICSPQVGGLFEMMMMIIKKSGFQLKHQIIWNKNNHVLGRCDYNYKHEPIFYGWYKKHKFYGNGEQKTSVWNINKPLKNDLHPTMKPIELIENAINNSTLKNMIVIDPFLGSGSTLISCEKTNRICYGIEIDPYYCDVIVKRFIDYVGSPEDIYLIRNDKKIKYDEIKMAL